MNCDKGDRDCVYASKSPKTALASPLLTDAGSIPQSSLAYFEQPFPFRPGTAQTPTLPGTSTPVQNYSYEDMYTSRPQSFETTAPFAPRSTTPSTASITTSPQIHHSSATSSTLVRNAALVNNVQSQSTLKTAIRSISKDFRLRGHMFTIESILSPLIYRSNSLKYAVFANFVLQSDHNKRPTSPLPTQDFVSLHVRHYNQALQYLQASSHNPTYSDENVAAPLILAFYSICNEDIESWTLHMRHTADRIRLRGATIESHPVSLHSKFLFSLFIRSDVMGSNALGLIAETDRELARIIYSGVPITNKSILSGRIELELLMAETSVFQYECMTLLGAGWHTPPQQTLLLRKYEDLTSRLSRWQTSHSETFLFEEAQFGEYPHGVMLPPEMGLPLLCLVFNCETKIDLE
jgi:Fungal specific transcription factor domain